MTRLFGNELVDIKTISLSDFNKKMMNNADLVFSTIPIPGTKNIIKINPVLSKQDLQEIKSIIDRKRNNIKEHLRDLFVKDLFIKGIKLDSKADVLNYLTDLMKEKGYIDQETKESIFVRESMASTELGRLLAIPHPLNSTMNKPVIAVGILKKPIVWDTEKVQVILVFSVPHQSKGLWENIFRRIYEFLFEDFGITKLITEYEYNDFIESLEKGRSSE